MSNSSLPTQWRYTILARATVIVVGCIVFLTASVLLERQRSAVYRIAEGMLGELWYRIELQTDHIGFMYNNVYQDHHGAWHFISTTHFLLDDNAPNTLSKHLVFDAKAPHPLRSATYTNAGGGEQLHTMVDKRSQGYTARLQRPGQDTRGSEEIALDWSFDLGTFLAFEHWLQTVQPHAGEQQVVNSPDFERLRIHRRTYRVVEHNDTGYLVENNAPFAASQTQLDWRMRPTRLNMSGIFNVIASSEADAIALTEMRQKTRYLFSVDQRIDDHTSLAALHLRLNGVDHLDLPRELRLTHNPISQPARTGRTSEHAGEELRFPITHPVIQTLVQRSVSTDAATTIAQLVQTAHEQIRYVENQPAGSVLTALAQGEGECTDYADLFTTLARAAGFPARNVYGLAYKDGPQPAFMFHAWNEVFTEGRWQAVDPTWNQIQVDASHIPLSNAQAALMMLANNTGAVSFSVLDTKYF